MKRRWVFALVVAGCAGAEDAATGCGATGFPEVDADLYVAATCAADGADGSLARPYTTLTAAVAAAADGAVIAVAPGTYAESLTLNRPVRIVGAVDAARGIILKTPRDDASIILQVPAPDALGIILKSPVPDAAAVTVASSDVTLVGLRVVDAGRAGVEVTSGAAVLEDCRVEGTRAVAGAYGSGVVARPGTHLTVRRSVVDDAAGAGVYFDAAAGAVESSLLTHNAAGGLRAAGGEAGIILQDSELDANVGGGAVLFGARGIILKRTAITGTTADSTGAAHGVVVGEDAGVPGGVRIEEGVTLSGHAGVGVLVTGAGSVATVDDAVITGNDRGGIWAQKGAGTSDVEGVSVTRSTVEANGYVGVCATLGAVVHVEDTSITGTQARVGFSGAAEVQVGDGVVVIAGRVRLASNLVEGNARLGLLADGVATADLDVAGNTFKGHPTGIILQHPKGGGLAVGENTLTDNTEDVVNATNETAVGVPAELRDGL